MTKNDEIRKPSLNSSDPIEKKYATWLRNLKGMRNGTHPSKFPEALMNLEKAEEWLSPVDFDSIEYISSQWENMIDFTGGLFPRPDMGEQGTKYSNFVRYVRKKFKSLDSEEQHTILKLPHAEAWIFHSTTEVKAIEDWHTILKYMQNEYGFNKMPSPANGPIEKKLYWIIYGHRRRIKQTGKTYDCMYELPMAKHWLNEES